ncbi:MAG: hypothetical protein LAT64_03980 [Phycisphaerales bacterium]|nr:hypothetical protein [Planctomycetota bacterium]MCH8507911.1 hypothetical protein [Phycisphaerales bacterium]
MTRKILLIAGFGFGLIAVSCCSLWTLAIGPPIPWSKRYFRPTDPISVWEANPDRERLASQASACGLAWSSTITGTQESRYESGPEYRFHLTPVSLDHRQIESWEIKLVKVVASSRANETVFTGTGSGPVTGEPTAHPLMESVEMYDGASVLLGELDSVRPGDTIELIVEVEVQFRSNEPACVAEVSIMFDCLFESGWLRVYR